MGSGQASLCTEKQCVYALKCVSRSARLINGSTVTLPALLQVNWSTHTHAPVCSLQYCRHVRKLTAQLYFNAIRQKLLFEDNTYRMSSCEPRSTTKKLL